VFLGYYTSRTGDQRRRTGLLTAKYEAGKHLYYRRLELLLHLFVCEGVNYPKLRHRTIPQAARTIDDPYQIAQYATCWKWLKTNHGYDGQILRPHSGY